MSDLYCDAAISLSVAHSASTAGRSCAAGHLVQSSSLRSAAQRSVGGDASRLDRRPPLGDLRSTRWRRYSGDRRSGPTMVVPSSRIRSWTALLSIASLTAPLSSVTTDGGVPFGRKSPLQLMASKSGRPCSCAVARSGTRGERSREERDCFDRAGLHLWPVRREC